MRVGGWVGGLITVVVRCDGGSVRARRNTHPPTSLRMAEGSSRERVTKDERSTGEEISAELNIHVGESSGRGER